MYMFTAVEIAATFSGGKNVESNSSLCFSSSLTTFSILDSKFVILWSNSSSKVNNF